MERLRAVKTGKPSRTACQGYEFKSFVVLLQYQGKLLANIPEAFEPSIERSATLVASYQPDADLTASMERYRTS
jgi:hypothetical protein